MDLREGDFEGWRWMNVTQDRFQWRILAFRVLNLVALQHTPLILLQAIPALCHRRPNLCEKGLTSSAVHTHYHSKRNRATQVCQRSGFQETFQESGRCVYCACLETTSCVEFMKCTD
jgi:hypothetical protein